MTRAMVIVAGLALAGCGGPPPEDGGSQAVPPAATTTTSDVPSSSVTLLGPRAALPERLLGRSFETRGPGDVTGVDLAADSALTISFVEDQSGDTSTIHASAGCNAMGGPVRWHDGIARPIDGFARTEMACQGLMEQENWYFDLLNAGPTYSLEGDYLTLTGPSGSGTILFADSAMVHPDQHLGGATWRLDGIVDGQGDDASVSSVPADLVASLTIANDPADGHVRLDVFDGLTWLSAPAGFDSASGVYSGAVTIEPADTALTDPLEATAGTVHVSGGLAGDAVDCPDGTSNCRVREMALFGSDFTFAIHRDRLTVDGSGVFANHGLIFVADPDAPAPDLSVAMAPRDNPLLGKTFELTRTFTDDGGADRMHADAALRLTFGEERVTAAGSCGEFGYDDVRYLADPRDPATLTYVDLGKPSSTDCVLGDDPGGPPSAKLLYGVDGDEMWLSTGFVAWYFEPVS